MGTARRTACGGHGILLDAPERLGDKNERHKFSFVVPSCCLTVLRRIKFFTNPTTLEPWDTAPKLDLIFHLTRNMNPVSSPKWFSG